MVGISGSDPEEFLSCRVMAFGDLCFLGVKRRIQQKVAAVFSLSLLKGKPGKILSIQKSREAVYSQRIVAN